MNKDELLEKLLEIIKLPVEDQYHDNYTRVCDLKTLYSQIISGKEIDNLLKQFVRREDDTMFKQRVNLTQQITPSIANGIIKTFNKVFRTTPAMESIDFEGDSETSVETVKEALLRIYGNKDIYKYLQDKFLYLSFVDPNAFIYTTFDSFDSKTEKPQPYNTEISSTEAINYEYFNNELQWLISRVPSTYIEGKKEKEGFIYTIFGPEFAYVMTQVGKDYVVVDGEVLQEIEVSAKEKKVFILDEYDHKSEVVPLIQVGYERDMETAGETFVSPIHAGVPYFMKLIKTVSEFDLTVCLHAFPKLFQYVDKCTILNDGTCQTSKCNPERCTLCNKTGIKVHTSAQDALLLKLPGTLDEMWDLSKMIHVETPDVAFIEMLDKLIDKYSTKVNKSVFNSETFTKSEIAKTATGENIDMQNVYDTLKPFAEKISDVWEHIARVVSYYLDFKGPIVAHAYPNDFKLKTAPELLDELSKANSAQAAGYVTSAIESDIMRQKYIDAPLEFQKYEAKQKFFPFNGKTKDEIQTIIMGGMVRRRDVILFNYFETIFAELENEYLANDIWFYDVEYKAQLAAIDKKIAEIDAELETAVQLDVSDVS